MMTYNDFLSTYKNFSNAELIDILDNPVNYEPQAIQAAKNEYASRHLSEQDIDIARGILSEQHLKIENRNRKTKQFEDGIKNKGLNILNTINPIQSNIHSDERILRIIAILFTVIFLYPFLSGLQFIKNAMADLSRFPILSLITLVPMILLLVGIPLFWKRKALGWILLTICMTFFISELLSILLSPHTWRYSGNLQLDKIFQRPPVTTYFIELIIQLAALYYVSKENIRNIFSINKDILTKTIVMTGIISLILLLFA